MNDSVRILVVEDSREGARTIEAEVGSVIPGARFLRVETTAELIASLAAFTPDVLVASFEAAGLDFGSTLRLAVDRAPDTPLIVFASPANEDEARESVNAGASDYVLRTDTGRLGPAVRAALANRRLRQQGQAAQAELTFRTRAFARAVRASVDLAAVEREGEMCELITRSLKDMTEGAIATFGLYDQAHKLIRMKRAEADASSGRDLLRALGPTAVSELSFPLSDASYRELQVNPVGYRMSLTEAAFGVAPEPLREAARRTPQIERFIGIAYWLEGVLYGTSLVALRAETPDPSPELLHLFAQMVAVTVRRVRTEHALRESETGFKRIFESANVGKSITFPTGEMTVNRAFCDLLGYTAEELRHTTWKDLTPPDDVARTEESMGQLMRGEKEATRITRRFLHKDGSIVWADFHAAMVRSAEGSPLYLVTTLVDVTERMRAEDAQRVMEERLRQAQKMETVGRLAGGVAHDFNNMLQVITSYAELALSLLDPHQPLHTYLQEIRRAAMRSAEITGQLLAFARKQTVSPTILDPNEAVAKSQKMLQRLIGEDIKLAWMPGHSIWKVKIDPAQLDQILANLSVNARDAIDGVGQLTVETENVVVDEAQSAARPGLSPGEFVQIAVSDTGRGMDKETIAHLFEPFFTTKELGKGTGLGLATIYGIVKQNNGFLYVYSEPGQGSTFRVYLPRADGQTPAPEDGPRPELARRGTETLLVVEDEAAILELTRESLRNLGYTVLTARSPEEALQRSREWTAPIHLLVTDVVMPQMNGRQLAERLVPSRPELKCLYMSGYTGDIIAHRGVLDEGMQFLPKPFSLAVLAQKVREILGG